MNYDEPAELKQDLELEVIDLDGVISRIKIFLESHEDFIKSEDLTEEADSIKRSFDSATESLNSIISRLDAISSDRESWREFYNER